MQIFKLRCLPGGNDLIQKSEPGPKSSQVDLLKWARSEVPAVKYAIGISGIAAAGSLALTFFTKPQTAVIVIGFMLAAMVLLYVFSKLAKSDSPHITAAALVLMWSVVVAFVVFISLTVTAVITGYPSTWSRLLSLEQPQSSNSGKIETLIKQVGVKDSVDGRRALHQLVAIAASGNPDDQMHVLRTLKGKFLATDDVNMSKDIRRFRKKLMSAILNSADNDMTKAFERGDLTHTMLVGMDFREVYAVGVDFSDTNLLASDFEGANLDQANFAGAYVRGVEFQNANLKDTNWERQADWFNAVGIRSEYLNETALSSMMLCPKLRSTGKDKFSLFIKEADDQYRVDFKDWREDEKSVSRAFWESYSEKGDMCDAVENAKHG
jgi:hypothetical protein